MLNRLKFAIDIDADASVIWDSLWSNYREWACVFEEGSYVLADNWDAGNTVHFLGPNHNGIYSIIEKHLPDERITFRHVGLVTNGKEQPVDEATKTWSGANETYSITRAGEYNTLTIEIDILDEHLDFMNDRLPKAMDRIKNNCC